MPANGSTAIGFSTVSVDTLTHLLTVDVSWNNLIGGQPAAAHIHCCAAPGVNVGVAVGFPGFPVTLSGTYFEVFNLLDPNIYTAGFRNAFGGGTAAGSEAALIAGMLSGMAYTNIHNATFPGGEIRGQLAEVPEPGTLSLIGLGLIGAAAIRRVRSRRT